MTNKYFEQICSMTQKELKETLISKLSAKYNDITVDDGFIFAKGTVPICLVAHMDTVNKEEPKEFVYIGDKVGSPQGIGGDDRCGVYAILKIIEHHNCSVLFCEDEEIGCVGAQKFTQHKIIEGLEFNYMIELDRKGNNDAVFYECDNTDFEDFITKEGDWKTDWGSFSDISIVAPIVGCAAVNLSCGYYKAHTLDEYVNLNELETNINKVCNLIARSDNNTKFIYVEAKYDGYLGWGSDYYSWYRGNNYRNDNNLAAVYDKDIANFYCIEYINEKGKADFYDVTAHSDLEAVGIFVVNNPTLTFDDIVSVEDYGEDVYAL